MWVLFLLLGLLLGGLLVWAGRRLNREIDDAVTWDTWNDTQFYDWRDFLKK